MVILLYHFCGKKECLIDRIMFKKKKSPAFITKSRGLYLLQDIDVFAGQSLVHAADSTEFSAHTAGVTVVIFRTAAVTDCLGSFRIQCTGILFFPVQFLTGICHTVILVPGSRDPFGNVCCVSGDLGGNDALFLRLLHWEEPDARQESHSKGRLHRSWLLQLRRWQL